MGRPENEGAFVVGRINMSLRRMKEDNIVTGRMPASGM
jgi:hypothetical protein